MPAETEPSSCVTVRTLVPLVDSSMREFGSASVTHRDPKPIQMIRVGPSYANLIGAENGKGSAMFSPDFVAVKNHLNLLNKHVGSGVCRCHAHGKEVLPDLYEVLRLAQMHTDASDVALFAAEAVAVLRAYRGRMHRVDEDEDGNPSRFHTCYGVHWDLMVAADVVLTTAREVGLLEVARREYL